MIQRTGTHKIDNDIPASDKFLPTESMTSRKSSFFNNSTSDKKIKNDNNQFRVHRAQRKKALEKSPLLMRIYHCNSKTQLKHIFDNLPEQWRKLLRNYLSSFFLYHVSIRSMKNSSVFISFRQVFYDALDDSSILDSHHKLQNNIVKNFCKGIVNFMVFFGHDLDKGTV